MTLSLDEIRRHVRETIAEVLRQHPDAIDDDAHLGRDLHVDSLVVVEVVLRLEGLFRIAFRAEEYSQLTSVNHIAACLWRLQPAAPSHIGATRAPE